MRPATRTPTLIVLLVGAVIVLLVAVTFAATGFQRDGDTATASPPAPGQTRQPPSPTTAPTAAVATAATTVPPGGVTTAPPAVSTAPTHTPARTSLPGAATIDAPAPCPAMQQASDAIGPAVERQNDEACLYVWRTENGPTTAICPTGSICTLSMRDGTRVYVGDNTKRAITAGSFRFPRAYPPDAPVHAPCVQLRAEQAYATAVGITAGNFSCTAAIVPPEAIAAPFREV